MTCSIHHQDSDFAGCPTKLPSFERPSANLLMFDWFQHSDYGFKRIANNTENSKTLNFKDEEVRILFSSTFLI